MELAAQAERVLGEIGAPDVILATDMVNVPAWLALMRNRLPVRIPLLLYMHENQLTYPRSPADKTDHTYAMINWLSMLSADHISFNSRYHHDSWFTAIRDLLQHFPDHNHLHRVEAVLRRTSILHVGIEPLPAAPSARRPDLPPLILWNQRWEYDKQPKHFFSLLYKLQAVGAPFRVAVAGETFRRSPAEFEIARGRLHQSTVQWGYLENRADYDSLLRQADLVISTALHEFFGVSILEAVVAGVFPLLPRRLSYPELLPEEAHPLCLYGDDEELFEMTRRFLLQPNQLPETVVRHVAQRFGWQALITQYDDLLDRLC